MISFLDGWNCRAPELFLYIFYISQCRSQPATRKIMNSVLAQLRQEREERQKAQDGVEATTGIFSVDNAETSGARRRKQSAPRRFVQESIQAVVSDDVVENPPPSKKRKEDKPPKQSLVADTPADSASSNKKSRPKGKTKTLQPPSSIEFEEQNNEFDAQELASWYHY